MDRASRIAAGSIGVSLLVMLLKGLAWWLTGSAALYSDALESIVNLAAASMAFIALRVAALPADANHLYGHSKAEFFSAVIEGGLIVAAAVSILQHAAGVFQHPQPVDAPLTGIALNGAATLMNALWATLLFAMGRRLRSPALLADARHLLTDMVTGVAVVIGVGLVAATGLRRIDPALAAAVALYILASGFLLIRESVGGLMDAAPSPQIVERIRRLVSEHAAGALEAHDLRTRMAGRVTYLEFHLVVPAAMTVAEAHDICDRIEGALREDVPGLVTTIHVEPEGKAKHHGVLVL